MKDKLKINPQVLRWAREEAGYPIEGIAARLEISHDRYVQWETTGEKVPFATLKLIASFYKRQIATFFLSEIPPKIIKPKDYRKLSLIDTPFSKETMLAFRRVKRYQGMLVDIHGQEYFNNKYRWLKEYENIFTKAPDFDQLAYWLRQKLEFPLEEQVKEKDSSTCYRRWRDTFEEKLGIFTFQFTLPHEETQGFSYSDRIPFCIAINTKNYSANSRIFTLFHELAHVLRHQSGICTPDRVVKEQQHEYEINRWAATLLIPYDKVTRVMDPDEIYAKAKRFKVSSEVYLRRMHHLDLITENEFFNLLQEIRARVKPSKEGGFGGSAIQRCIAARGWLFYDSIVTAAKNGVLSYSQASEVLGLKANYFIFE